MYTSTHGHIVDCNEFVGMQTKIYTVACLATYLHPYVHEDSCMTDKD